VITATTNPVRYVRTNLDIDVIKISRGDVTMIEMSKTKAKQLERERKAVFSNQIINKSDQSYRVFSIKGRDGIYGYPITETEAWGIVNNKG
jgi:hypothetical protein